MSLGSLLKRLFRDGRAEPVEDWIIQVPFDPKLRRSDYRSPFYPAMAQIPPSQPPPLSIDPGEIDILERRLRDYAPGIDRALSILNWLRRLAHAFEALRIAEERYPGCAWSILDSKRPTLVCRYEKREARVSADHGFKPKLHNDIVWAATQVLCALPAMDHKEDTLVYATGLHPKRAVDDPDCKYPLRNPEKVVGKTPEPGAELGFIRSVQSMQRITQTFESPCCGSWDKLEAFVQHTDDAFRWRAVPCKNCGNVFSVSWARHRKHSS